MVSGSVPLHMRLKALRLGNHHILQGTQSMLSRRQRFLPNNNETSPKLPKHNLRFRQHSKPMACLKALVLDLVLDWMSALLLESPGMYHMCQDMQPTLPRLHCFLPNCNDLEPKLPSYSLGYRHHSGANPNHHRKKGIYHK